MKSIERLDLPLVILRVFVVYRRLIDTKLYFRVKSIVVFVLVGGGNRIGYVPSLSPFPLDSLLFMSRATIHDASRE